MWDEKDIDVTVRASYLAAASLVCAKTSERHCLQGVYVEPCEDGGVYVVATDGHRMVVFRDPAGKSNKHGRAFKIGRDFRDAAKFCRRGDPLIAIIHKGDLHLCGVEQRTILRVGVESVGVWRAGEYSVNWRSVLSRPPGKSKGKRLTAKSRGWNPTYLGAFGRVLRTAYGPDGGATINMEPRGDRGAIITAGEKDFLGVLMPVRIQKAKVPPWVKQLTCAPPRPVKEAA